MIIKHEKNMTPAEHIAAENSNNQFLQELAYAAQTFPGELKKGTKVIFLGGDASSATEVVLVTKDYVVEQGKSGIWTYRKWASGIAECWGTINIQFDKEVANKWIGEDGVEDSGFYGLGEIPQSNITFPFDFVETPLVDVVLQSTPCTVFIAKNSSNNYPLRNTGEIRVYRPLKFPDYVFDREFVFGYSVKGRWK